MTLTLIRTKYLSDRTIGALHIDDVLFCDTLEPSNFKRAFSSIQTGEYTVTLKVQSPKFLQSALYKDINAMLPRLQGVQGREGILIHIGNYPKDTQGCILVGRLNANDDLQNSRITFNSLYNRLKAADKRGEVIRIFII